MLNILTSLSKQVEPFTYLGRLAYVANNDTREQPVYFKRKIIDWEIPPTNILSRMDLTLNSSIKQDDDIISDYLFETRRPNWTVNTVKASRSFHSSKPNYAEKGKRSKELGLNGELLVVDYLLNNLGYDVDDVIHTSDIEGDGAGYDIEVIKDGNNHYI